MWHNRGCRVGNGGSNMTPIHQHPLSSRKTTHLGSTTPKVGTWGLGVLRVPPGERIGRETRMRDPPSLSPSDPAVPQPMSMAGGTIHPWVPPHKRRAGGVLRRAPCYLLAWGERGFWGDGGPLIWGAASTHLRPWVLRPWVRHQPVGRSLSASLLTPFCLLSPGMLPGWCGDTSKSCPPPPRTRSMESPGGSMGGDETKAQKVLGVDARCGGHSLPPRW